MLACEIRRCWSALNAFLVLELVHFVVNGVQDSTNLFASVSKALSSQELHAPSSQIFLATGGGCLHNHGDDYGGIGTPCR